MNKIKLTANILFAGIGCQERGIKNSNLFDLEVNSISEINKEAVLSYAAVHCGLTPELISTYSEYPSKEEMARQLTEINLGYEPEKDKRYNWEQFAKRKGDDIKKYWLANKLSNNLGDINQIEFLSYADLWTCSFPCTDISLAGNMKGLSPDSGTRSSLLWENIRLLKRAKEDGIPPKYILFENVKNLVSKKFMPDFNNLLEVLNELGFNSYWQVINAKDCGIPQNRERVFVICIRKDIDNGTFTFPKPFDNGLRLKDMLEDNVDEKYYINNDNALKLIKSLDNDIERERVSKATTCQSINQPSLTEQIVSQQDMTVESAQSRSIEPALLSYRGSKLEKMIDIAPTLLARDYKGFGKYGMAGVIEYKNGNQKDNE